MKRGFMRHALHIPRTPAYPVPFHKKQKYQRLKQEIYDYHTGRKTERGA